jgi:D-glycero-D-manno-heptose 1,7-bisphosphate phosphatase
MREVHRSDSQGNNDQPARETSNWLIILDRDGVINQDRDDYVKSAEEWIPIPGSLAAISRLSNSGYKIAIATNQSGLGRGLYRPDDLKAMHEKMTTMLTAHGGVIHAIAYCPHLPDDHCDCRKPGIGLVRDIEKQLGQLAANAFFVGDKLSDIETAIRAGCIPVLVRTGKGRKTEEKLQARRYPYQVMIFDDLATFTEALLSDSIKPSSR